MRDFLRSSGRQVRAGWFWPLVLLALPNCILNTHGTGAPDLVFNAGQDPRSSAVMCDIPKPLSTTCADATAVGIGISTSHAALALAQGETSSLALDFSSDATNQCSGFPKKTEFYGAYPDGLTVCLNCQTQMPNPYADGNAVCVAQCIDLVNQNGPEPPGAVTVEEFCNANAHVSTNFDKNVCFDNACTSGGTPDPNFADPRRIQEPIKWVTQNGTKNGATGNNLTRTALPSGTFDAGGYSGQLISHGDAWVEFEVSDNTKSYALGWGHGDLDALETLDDIAFAIVLKNDNNVYIYEDGLQVQGPIGAPYSAGERFRVTVADNNDGKHTASLKASRLVGPCATGTVCNENVFFTESVSTPDYPLRVDASLVDPGALLVNVTLVHIQ